MCVCVCVCVHLRGGNSEYTERSWMSTEIGTAKHHLKHLAPSQPQRNKQEVSSWFWSLNTTLCSLFRFSFPHYRSDPSPLADVPSVSGAVGATWPQTSVFCRMSSRSSSRLNRKMSLTGCPDVPRNLRKTPAVPDCVPRVVFKVQQPTNRGWSQHSGRCCLHAKFTQHCPSTDSWVRLSWHRRAKPEISVCRRFRHVFEKQTCFRATWTWYLIVHCKF